MTLLRVGDGRRGEATTKRQGDQCMSKAQKTADSGREPFRKLSDSETLLFVTRTMERTADRQAPDLTGNMAGNLAGKLQSLKDVLAEVESTLLNWPDTPGKVRMWSGIAKAKGLVTQIAGDCAAAATGETEARASKTA
jgi:hypothetical protein